MNEVLLVDTESVPCPHCDYDLRAQSSARCPECGFQFESLQAMIEASRDAGRLFLRVMVWRQRLAYFTFFSIVLIICTIFFEVSLGRVSRIASIGVVLLWPLSGLLALILLVQVIRWRFHPLIPRRQRAELNGSIPWLMFLTMPLILAVVVVVMLLF